MPTVLRLALPRSVRDTGISSSWDCSGAAGFQGALQLWVVMQLHTLRQLSCRPAQLNTHEGSSDAYMVPGLGDCCFLSVQTIGQTGLCCENVQSNIIQRIQAAASNTY